MKDQGMERGARAIAIMLIVALVLGTFIVLIQGDYRESFRKIWKGRPADAPIWNSNADYYPAVDLERPRKDHPHAQ